MNFHLISRSLLVNLIVGADGGEGPPVPIPNTEVKLVCVENTWLETAWENRTTPALVWAISSVG